MIAAFALIIGLVILNGLWRVADAATDAVMKPKKKSRRKKK